jgi:hypothetical protein
MHAAVGQRTARIVFSKAVGGTVPHPKKHHIIKYVRHSMKKIALTLLLVVASLGSASADAVIKDVMKKDFKPEDAIAKKVGKGEATDAELDTLIKDVAAISAATPSKGDKGVWTEKTKAMSAALAKVKAKDSSGMSEWKKAVNCKACHDVFKGK